MKKWNIEKLLGILMLVFAVGFNLWLYRLEPTATVDPNDNAFQFGLVDRTNTMWDFATRKCSSNLGGIITFPICHFLYLADHWVPNWADGFNLPYYYSHMPQILIVGSWRIVKLFVPTLTLFHFYHIVIYLLLCLFPISVFLALRVMGSPRSSSGQPRGQAGEAGFSWLTAGIGALFSTNLSTDGLYGLDPSSFLWRGYGLSSQLFAMTWFPLAIAYAYRFFTRNDMRFTINDLRFKNLKSYFLNLKSDFLLAVVFTVATTAGHLGIGMIAMMSLGFLAVTEPLMKILRQEPLKNVIASATDQAIRLTVVAGASIFLLSYWIVPTFLDSNFHNISFWDPVWKFNSYGVKETMIRLFNGDLFDFGRLPVITYLILLGVVVSFLGAGRRAFSSIATQGMDEKKPKNSLLGGDGRIRMPTSAPDLSPLSFLFIFWLLFYFGRTTWGSLIDIIPGMKDFHLSRFIVGVHMAGMFLAPIGFVWLAENGSRIVDNMLRNHVHLKLNNLFIRLFVYSLIGLILLPPVFQWTMTYNKTNDFLILRANTNHAAVAADEQALFAKLRSLPAARIFAGRGGGYGKEFRVAETPYFMQLSTYGLQTTLWLPETWSMNSDTEQYFSDDKEKDYDLYNMRWAAAPPDQTPQPFWKFIDEASTWKLYEVATSGYFATGVRAATVSITKMNFVNLVHLWIQSDASKNGLFPELTFDKSYPKTYGLPNFKMTDEADYVTPDGKLHSLFNEPPVYLPPGVPSEEQFATVKKQQYDDMKLLGPETDDTDMIFSTKVEVGKNCRECLVILKETFHPDWRVTVNGERRTPIIVFPFYPAVQISAPGTYTVVFSYKPSTLKTLLLYLALVVVVVIAGMQLRHRHGQK